MLIASRFVCGLSLFSAALAMLVFPGGARAVDDSEKFVEALREERYYDVAIDYLDTLQANPATSQEFKEKIDYEAGAILIEHSRTIRSLTLREQTLAKAEQRLNKFTKEHPQNPLVSSAKRQLANLLVERGRIKCEQATLPNKTPDDKKRLSEEGRTVYVQAQKVYAALEEAALETLKKMPKVIPDTDTKAKEEQRVVRQDLLEARLALAAIGYEIAQTYPPGSKESKESLTDSAKRYNSFFEKYSALLAGGYARMWEGRNYRELGDYDKALKIFQELYNGPDEPESFRLLKNKATIMALETASLDKVKKYKAAVAMFQDWDKNARGAEENSAEGLAIKYLGAIAALEQAKTLKPTDKEYREHIKIAKTALIYVKRFAGEYQARARAALQDPVINPAGETQTEPTNYADARDRAKSALDRLTEAETKLKLDQEQGKTDTKEKYEEEMEQARLEALKYFRMALDMAPKDISADDLNALRYYLSYLYYATEQYPEAAVLGEFLARHYPTSVGGKPGARLAMAAYAQMGGGQPDHPFETGHMVAIAEYMAGRWAGEPEADQAWMTLIGTAVRNRDLAKATEYLNKIPAESPKRADAELATGQALWGAYLQAARLPEDQRPKQEKLNELISQAQKILEDGINRMAKSAEGTVTYPLVAGVLSLAQIDIDAGEADKAVRWLDDPKIGAKTLVDKNDPATQQPNFAVETYKAALRAYVATQQLDKAETVMNTLEKLVKEGGDAEAGKRLTQIYISLGVELEKQLTRLRSENKTAEVAKVSQGFELFLTKILQREKGNNFNSLNWVAQTFYSLGSGFDTASGKVSAQAESYYKKAAESYQKILTRLDDPDFGAPKDAVYSVKIRLARCWQRLGTSDSFPDAFGDAMTTLLEILKEKPLMIDAQVEAAKTYQAWGRLKPGYYDLAISGSKKYKEIWGWGQLARKLQSIPKFKDVFFDARYNLAVCRYEHAIAESGETKTKLLEQAVKDVEIMFRLYPDLGGKESFDKFDELLRKVQKARGDRPTGLEGLAKAADAEDKKQK